MNAVSADGNELTIDGTRLVFDDEIGGVVQIESGAVVRLEIPPEKTCNRNVIAINNDGTIRWRIPEAPDGSSGDKPYMDIYLQDGELWAGNWICYCYRIDQDTGELLEREFEGRM
ncbi:hypothetical protein SAMN05216559_4186 [Halomicrobium zhouii]|uniref:Uncharacterized protein n=1 Tax=Halomicrobium zhouii TaxID=767519 RepID=A0A1I6MBS3_9EURY|nr:hypothetical protein [Halomicrobium zhouii]SFS13048.1 hypothetical protein SAMN05216559_4186 [Halomicrobium zhouii]